MKKKVISLLSLLACILMMFTACGSDSEKTYGGYTENDLYQESVNLGGALAGYSHDDLNMMADQYMAYAQQQGDESMMQIAQLISDWSNVTDGIGGFKGFTDFKIEPAGKTYVATLVCEYDLRSIKFTTVYTKYNMEVKSMNGEAIYSTKEKMGKAALNTVMGILIVFIVLVLISFIISAFKIIYKIQNGDYKKAKEAPQPVAAAAEVAAPVVAASDDDELIAVIAAAIAAATGTSTDDFVVRTIKRRA